MQLPPELLAQFQEAINSGQLTIGNPSGRSPMKPRQLHNLTLLPTAEDPRPTFFWSALPPRDGVDLTRTTEFPKLMWHGQTGTEIAVTSRDDQQAHLSMGYILHAPAGLVVDPMDAIRAAWDALSAEDQVLLVEAQKQDRINALRAKLSQLEPDKLEALLASAEPKAKKGKVA